VHLEAEEFLEREEVDAAEVEIRVGRRESVKMGAADGGEEERVRLSGDDAMKARIEGHGEGDCVKIGIVRLDDCVDSIVVNVHQPMGF